MTGNHKRFEPLTRRILEPPFILFLVFILSLFFISPFLLSQNNSAQEWHLLYLRIRDSQISKEDALAKLKSLEPFMKDHYTNSADRESEDRLCFPLKGYGPSAIGGKEGSGYQPGGYDFFDGNRHKGHPAKVGQIVSKGERLGTVGRTGAKAYPKRSPTHLHFQVLQSVDGFPNPSTLVWS